LHPPQLLLLHPPQDEPVEAVNPTELFIPKTENFFFMSLDPHAGQEESDELPMISNSKSFPHAWH
jgi:hypothetical protein